MSTLKEKSKVFSIVVRGTSNSGKSTTIQEVCQQLNPVEIYALDIRKQGIDRIDGRNDSKRHIYY